MSDCIFCRINKGEIPSAKVHDDSRLFAIKDINPVAPVHILIIPKKHHATLLDLETSDHETVGAVFTTANKIARDMGLAQSGFRVIANCGAGAGQSVFHIHFHLLSGRPLAWPPG